MKKKYILMVLLMGYYLSSLPLKDINIHDYDILGKKLISNKIYKIKDKIGILDKKGFFLFDKNGIKEDKGYYSDIFIDNNLIYGIRYTLESNKLYNFEIYNISKNEKVFNKKLSRIIDNKNLILEDVYLKIFFKKNNNYYYPVIKRPQKQKSSKNDNFSNVYLLELNKKESDPNFYQFFYFEHGNLKYCNNNLIFKEDDFENNKIIIKKYNIGRNKITESGKNVFSSVPLEDADVFFICMDKNENYYFILYYGMDVEKFNKTKERFVNIEIVKLNSSDEILAKKTYSLRSETDKDYLFNYYNYASLPIATYYEESTDKVVVFYVKDNKELVYEYFDEVKKK